MRRRTALSLLAASAALSLSPRFALAAATAAKVDPAAAKLVPKDIRKRGTITMASDATYPPFEYIATDNKTVVGYDVDIIHAIAATLGLHAKITNIDFDSIIPGLKAHRYDLSMSAFSITPDRLKVADFVGPYYVGGAAIAVLTGNPLGVTADPMSLCGRSVGAEAATTEAVAILPHWSKECVKAGKPAIKMRSYTNQSQVNLALSSGRIAAQLTDALPMIYMAQHVNKNFEVIPGTDFFPTNYGIAMPKNSPLEPAIKAALAEIKTNGVLNAISKKWDVPENTWLHPAKNYKIYGG